MQIKHQLGFSILLTDLGGPLEAKDQTDALKARIDAIVKLYHDAKPTVGKPYPLKFAGGAGQGTNVRYKDSQGRGHTCLVSVLGGPKFSVACVIQYLDEDQKDALPSIKKILNSLEAIP